MRFPNLKQGLQAYLFCILGIGWAWTASAVLANTSATHDLVEARPHVKDLGITIGRYAPGEMNAITDVQGVKVGHVTIHEGEGALQVGQGPVRTGVTVIIPREDVWHHKVPAGAFVINGTGEMTGLAWVAESGFLEYPIALTNTLNVPRVADGVMSWMIQRYPDIGITDDTLTPVVAECDDSRLNDSQGRHVSPEDVVHALETATRGPVPEGSVGAGTGMVSYQFKGGIGTASRVLPSEDGGYRVGVLVNANHGRRHELTIAGVPVGQVYNTDLPMVSHKELEESIVAALGELPGAVPPQRRQDSGSIIIIIATDAPLDARQLSRLSRRATIGLARTGSISHHGSGDFVLAFSTGNVIPHYPEHRTFFMAHLADTHINPLFQATVEATEEAILNALLQATTVTGRDGRRFEAISVERLRSILNAYGRPIQ
ncbi:DmpA family aminopeptidase [Candidatus Nitrospira allomarina]|uniref:P1 family peptidase n=1 Tax=Candidatus Nitrospira allomarina TaxID=3020900 RepID=A0AA96GEM4_9BACT|nr:P1 family peptidase [Candidatus Nitrospira allomarina]WNM58795.1 P1 family peptidase [Candidatus Nitrospira allomarina]